MGKRKGRQRDTAFTTLSDEQFRAEFYERRATFADGVRIRVEREAKARGIRNVQKRTK